MSDGDPSRGQRESLLSTEIQKVGVANGPHQTYRHCSAIITSSEFENTFDKDDNGLLVENKPTNKNKTDYTKMKESNGDKIEKNNEDKDKKDMAKTGKKKDKSDGKEELPPGIASINKTEKIIVENGDKKKVTRIIKEMEDGSKQIETIKEILDE